MDNNHAGIGNKMAGLFVPDGIESNRCIFRNEKVSIYDRPPDLAMPADLNVRENNRIFYCTIAMDSHSGRQNAAGYLSSRNDASI